jgi:hypothetical protein
MTGWFFLPSDRSHRLASRAVARGRRWSESRVAETLRRGGLTLHPRSPHPRAHPRVDGAGTRRAGRSEGGFSCKCLQLRQDPRFSTWFERLHGEFRGILSALGVDDSVAGHCAAQNGLPPLQINAKEGQKRQEKPRVEVRLSPGDPKSAWNVCAFSSCRRKS